VKTEDNLWQGRIAGLARVAFALVCVRCLPTVLAAQELPDVRCTVEDYAVNVLPAWQFPDSISKIQVVVLRDPAGEQEARFDLMHGATLISLRYHGEELLYGHSAGAGLEMYAIRVGHEEELKGLSPYWSAFHPTQGGSSMGAPAPTAGVACKAQQSMRAFAMMVDGGVDNSFQPQPLLAVWKGRVSDNFPPGYSTPYAIETDASWAANPGKTPGYYLRLDQTVVNLRPAASGSMEWFLSAAAPWGFEKTAAYPENCTEKKPCSSASVPVITVGRYRDPDRRKGFSTVVPTAAWQTTRAYFRENAEYVVMLYGAVWAAPRHTFATVLTRSIQGVSAVPFTWYICAGSWEQAQVFAHQTALQSP
jgi:hypothetical protein